VTQPPVLLTGATGFLGMEVLARLLERGDRDVVCLVRAGDAAGAAERLEGVLRMLWDDPAPYRERAHAVAGDVTRSGLGIDSAERTSLAEDVGAIIHCAASIAFDLPLEEARAINVEGTREVIGFAREARALGRLTRLVHVSTAYVSGRHSGVFRERQLDVGQTFRNTYEQTKWEAEHILAEAGDLAPVVARPSIVMGDALTGWTPAFNVLYWPVRAFLRGLFDVVPALPHGRVDVVTVDYVAAAILALLDGKEVGVFNLVAGSDSITVEQFVALAADRLGRATPPVIPRADASDEVSRGTGEVFLPYFEVESTFDDRRARAVLGPAGLRPTPLSQCFSALMDFADAARWGKKPIGREAARRRIEPAAA
jgi:thioester reductase-like protein